MRYFGLILFFVVGCAEQAANQCSVEDQSDGVLIECGGESVFVSNGTDGATGEAGPQGPQGEQGEAGPADSGSFMTGSIHCHGPLENTSLYAKYNAYQFWNGNVWVTGSVYGSVGEYSNSKFYSPDQNGFIDAPVTFTNDVSGSYNGGYWNIALNRDTLVTNIVYYDSDLVGGELSWFWTTDQCIVNEY